MAEVPGILPHSPRSSLWMLASGLDHFQEGFQAGAQLPHSRCVLKLQQQMGHASHVQCLLDDSIVEGVRVKEFLQGKEEEV